MSLSKPNALSFLVTRAGQPNQAVYAYTSPQAAEADFAQQDSASGVCYLYLESMPTKELKPSKLGGIFQDAYGAWRVVGNADQLD
jgi:hypothetical protein